MRAAALSIPLLALILAAAPPARSAPIQRPAVVVLALYTTLDVGPVFFEATGPVTVDTASSGRLVSLGLPAGMLATTTQVVTTASNVDIRIAASNGPGAFAEDATGGFGGIMPILGTLRVCLFGTCDGSPVVDLALPLDVVGAGGTVTTTLQGFTLSVAGAPWGEGPVTLSGPGFVSVFEGYRSGPLGGTSTTTLTGGFVQLVSPVHVAIPNLDPLEFVAVLDVEFVPEPGVAILLATGLLGLGLLRLGLLRATR